MRVAAPLCRRRLCCAAVSISAARDGYFKLNTFHLKRALLLCYRPPVGICGCVFVCEFGAFKDHRSHQLVCEMFSNC